jgi:O-antigen/teichoic acid export membrane protein
MVALGFSARSLDLRFDFGKWREMVRFSLPLVPSGVAVFLLQSTDRLLIRRFLSFDDLGVYAVAFRLASAVSLAMAGVQLAAGPIVLANSQRPDARIRLARLVRWAVAGGLVVALCLGSFAPELVSVVSPSTYARAARIVPWLVFSALLAQAYVFFPGLVLARRSGAFAVITGAAAVIGVVSTLVLVPRYGITGAAMGSVIGASASAIAHALASQRSYPVPHAWPPIAAAFLLCLLAAVGATWWWHDPKVGTGLVLKAILVAAGAAATAAVALGSNEIRAAVAVLRRRESVAPPDEAF